MTRRKLLTLLLAAPFVKAGPLETSNPDEIDWTPEQIASCQARWDAQELKWRQARELQT